MKHKKFIKKHPMLTFINYGASEQIYDSINNTIVKTGYDILMRFTFINC
jgi:hypothetical protein